MAQEVFVRSRTRSGQLQTLAEPAAGRPRLTCEYVPAEAICVANRQTRRRKDAMVAKHAECIDAHGLDIPIFAARSGEIIYGHDTYAAYRLNKRETVPVIFLDDRTPAELTAIGLWLEGHHADGEWDYEKLKDDFESLLAEAPDLLASAYWDFGEIDLILHKDEKKPALSVPMVDAALDAVARDGDVFTWSSGHRAICGNSRLPETYAALMANETARLLACDPPFGTSVAAISKRHKEWLDGSGKSEADMAVFFEEFLTACRPHLINGALTFCFIDQKGMHPLLLAHRSAQLEQKNICTWDKGGGVGGFLMNVAEYVVIGKSGSAKPVFRPKAGFKTTLWSVPGYSQFRPDREAALANHACTKPQGVLMPILLMASNFGDICLDPFLGSGSMMLAAERARRRCFGIEIDPKFVDTTVRRMRELTGEYPVHEASGLAYDALAAERDAPLPRDAR